ncbi:MAG: PaaX family transcriptional regulator C-terminal domain-containing protein [Pseudomonadales bacterium]
MNAHTEELASRFVLQTMASDCWRLDELSERYEAFLQRFRPLLKAVSGVKQLASEDAFQIRTLLIHEYRKILLKDTDLPDEVLPADWVVRAACNLTANLYRATHQQAEVYWREVMETADGRLPKATGSYYQRFGGL